MTSQSIFKHLIARLKGPSKHEQGQVIVMVGLAALVLFGVIGLAVDIGRMYIMKAELSRAMDAAALAGVLELPDEAKAKAACNEYLLKNEPNVLPIGTSELCTSPGENTLQVRGRKNMNMFFISVLGINDAAVSGKAKAGFGVAFLDAAIVLDSTSSMADTCNGSQNNTGCPIWEAKNAAKAFKDVLLGPSPDGNTSIGVAAFRGCYRDNTATSNNPLSPKGSASSNCVADDGTSTTQVVPLLSNKTTLDTKINAISAIGGSGTNVCGGMLKGWEVLNGSGNHQLLQNSLKYMIVLSDGDNNYNGSYSWQATPYASPHSYTNPATGITYSCQPPSSCSNVGGESSSTPVCHNGIQTALTTEASDNFPAGTPIAASDNFPAGTPISASDNLGSSSLTTTQDGFDFAAPAWPTGQGTGSWVGTAWVPSTATAAIVGTTNAQFQGGSRSLLLGRSTSVGNIYRTFSLANQETASLTYYARRNSNFTGTDTVCVQVSTDGTNWTNLHRFGSGTCTGTGAPANTTTSATAWTQYTDNLNTYAGQSTVYVRFLTQAMDSNSDQFYIDTVNIAANGCSNNWSNGTGWLAGWTRTGSGTDAPTVVSSVTPNDTTCHIRMRGVGVITRTVNLSSVSTASLTYYAKYVGWAAGDQTVVEASTNGTSWTTLTTRSTANLTTGYVQYTEDLTPFTGSATVYLRFRGVMPTGNTAKNLYLDTLSVAGSSCNGISGGSGWAANWTISPSSGNDMPTFVSTSTPNDTACHAQLRGVGTITRTVNLTTATSASLIYYAKKANWESGDTVVVEASSNGTTWTALRTHTNTTGAGTAYGSFTEDLSAFIGQPTVYLRFRGAMTANDLTDQFYVDTVSVTGASCNGVNGGTGWASSWTATPASGNDAPTFISTISPNDTACHAQIRGVGTLTRSVDLSGVSTANITYYAKRANWESGDTVVVEVSTNGTTWTTLTTRTTANTGTAHTQYTEDLSSYTGGTVYVRFRGAMTANDLTDQFYLDTLVVQSGAASSAGYLNGQDSSPACNETAAKRERQLDMETLALAQALKADGVEIYVVSFGACATNSTVYTSTQCQPFTIAGGLIGNTDNDNTSDQRLAKCIAGSKPSTNDHWFYSSSASGLPAIFTQIAKQIAHRLIE